MKSIVPTKPKCLSPKGHEENNDSLSFGWAKQCLHCSYGLSIIGCVDMFTCCDTRSFANSHITPACSFGGLQYLSSVGDGAIAKKRLCVQANWPAPKILWNIKPTGNSKHHWSSWENMLGYHEFRSPPVSSSSRSTEPRAERPAGARTVLGGLTLVKIRWASKVKKWEKQESWFIPIFQKQNITNERDWTSKFT